MKDIDFDELDKAVSSLMNNTPDSPQVTAPSPAAAPQPASDSAPVAPAEPAASTDDSSTPIRVTNNSKPIAATPVAAAQTPAQKRTGRFMDVVPSRPVSAPLSTPSREGTAITPPAASASPEPTPVAEPKAIDAPKELETTATDWPDPIAAAEPTPEPTTEVTVPDEPLGSPFLADAKVEKRPLNAGNTEPAEQPKEEASPENKEPTDAAPSEAGEDEPPTPPPIPAELNSDLIAIESNELKAEAHSDETDNKKADAPATSDTAEDDKDPEPEKKAEDETPVPAGPSSIVQQYKEQPSTGDESHAAIYDSSHFPEPLAHPAKKSSGWLWVLWVVLLLAVGAGGAVALYALGIIN